MAMASSTSCSPAASWSTSPIRPDRWAKLFRVTAPGGRLLIYNLPNRFSYLERIARHTGHYYHGALEHDRVYTKRSATAIVAGAGWRVEAARRRNMLPLSIPAATLNRVATPVWKISSALSHVPILSLVATTVEVEATRPGALTLAPPTTVPTATTA